MLLNIKEIFHGRIVALASVCHGIAGNAARVCRQRNCIVDDTIGLIPNPECSRVGPEEWVIQASLRKLNVLAAQLVQAEPIVISAADSSYW